METPSTPVTILYLYQDADRKLMEELDKQLSTLRDNKQIVTRHKGQIKGGNEWQQDMDQYIEDASLILLLISPDFLDSLVSSPRDLQHAMERYKENKVHIIPILLRDCDYIGAPFGKLSILPHNGKSINSQPDHDTAFREIVEEIKKFLKLPPSSFNPLNRIYPQVVGNLSEERSPIGREELLLQVKRGLKATYKGPSSVVLHGQPGVGKTTIAAELAFDEELHAFFPGGVLWAGLGQNPSIDNILATWESGLQVDRSRATTIREKIACIKAKLGQTPFLLILDDLWKQTPEINLLLGMVSGRSASLITTLHRGVASNLCSSKDGREMIFVNELDESTSLTLLDEICQHKISASELRPFVKITGGLPLTLKLLGAAINREHDLSNIRQKLLQRKNLPYLPVPENMNQCLKDIIDISIDDLPDQKTKDIFFALGVFAPKPASFSKEAMSFVTGADHRHVQTLHERNLLQQISHDRYTLHQSLSDVAQIYLLANDAARSRHRIYYQKLIEQTILLDRKGTFTNINWRTLFIDLPQIRAIRLPPAHASIFSIVVNRLAGSIPWLRRLDNLPHWLKHGLSWMMLTGLSLLEKTAHMTRREHIEATLANYRGWVYAEIGDREQAQIHYEHAHNLLSNTISDDNPKLAQVLNNRGKTHYMQSEYRSALKAYHRALVIYRKQKQRISQAHILTNIGTTFDMIERTNWAKQSFHAALDLYGYPADQIDFGSDATSPSAMSDSPLPQQSQEERDERGEALALHHLGVVYRGLGEGKKALFYLEQALTKHTNTRNQVGLARTLTEIGLVYLEIDSILKPEQVQHSLEVAMRYFQQALELQKEYGDLAWQGRTLSRIGQVYTKQGKMKEALNAYLQALSIHQNINYYAGLSTTLGFISNVFAEAGKSIQAQKIADHAKSEQTQKDSIFDLKY